MQLDPLPDSTHPPIKVGLIIIGKIAAHLVHRHLNIKNKLLHRLCSHGYFISVRTVSASSEKYLTSASVSSVSVFKTGKICSSRTLETKNMLYYNWPINTLHTRPIQLSTLAQYNSAHSPNTTNLTYDSTTFKDSLVIDLATLNLTLGTGSLASFSTTGSMVSLITSSEQTSTRRFTAKRVVMRWR